MSVIRFYVRNEDGAIEGDETCVNDRRDLSAIAKGFTVLGQHKEFVLEFDPPLLTPGPSDEEAVERVAKALWRLEWANQGGAEDMNWKGPLRDFWCERARAAIAAFGERETG